jgi:DNA-binding beta-propeller fold protein YncE
MKSKMIRTIALLAVVFVAFADRIVCVAGNVEFNILRTLNLETTPIDVAISPDGRQIYVLNDRGEILVYSSTHKLEGKIKVDDQVDQIKLGPRGDTLILTSSQIKTIQIATVDFIKEIDITGAPIKGVEEAKVAIVVFDDFQ